jgi:hypothetical protein
LVSDGRSGPLTLDAFEVRKRRPSADHRSQRPHRMQSNIRVVDQEEQRV